MIILHHWTVTEPDARGDHTMGKRQELGREGPPRREASGPIEVTPPRVAHSLGGGSHPNNAPPSLVRLRKAVFLVVCFCFCLSF